MKNICYVCLDDEEELVGKLLRRVEAHFPNLSIECRAPRVFEAELVAIQNAHRNDQLHGILLDLRLDEAAPEGSKPVRYTATGLAAQLRSWLSTRKQEVTGFPIVLWSVETRMQHAFKADASNKDLFDLIFHKEDFPDCSVRAAQELVGMVSAYRDIAAALKRARTFSELLQPVSTVELDPRIGIQFSTAFRSQPTHRYAQFIFTYLIERPGTLVDEHVLCARLGIDFDSPGKGHILERLGNSCAYRGPFSDWWPRWWQAAVDTWWQTMSKGERLARLSASERVEVLAKRLKASGLNAAKPFAKGYSTYFSTVCSHTKKPLDPVDGFVLSETQSQPWLSRCYVARDVALDPAAYDFHGKIEPLDAERLRALREKLRSHGGKSGKAKSARD